MAKVSHSVIWDLSIYDPKKRKNEANQTELRSKECLILKRGEEWGKGVEG
jgi:hypothetical protein